LAIARVEAPKTFRVIGAELGYRYAGSPVICDEPGGPAPNIEEYVPTSWPGARLPHVWLKPGEISVHDRIADGFTLLRLARNKDDAAGLRTAFGAIGAPFSTLDVDSEAARRAYDAVSYTHLDVYKRQGLVLEFRLNNSLPCAIAIGCTASALSKPRVDCLTFFPGRKHGHRVGCGASDWNGPIECISSPVA